MTSFAFTDAFGGSGIPPSFHGATISPDLFSKPRGINDKWQKQLGGVTTARAERLAPVRRSFLRPVM